MRKIAILGSGYVGRMHAGAVKKSGRLELAAFVDSNPEKGAKAASDFGVPCYAGAEEMIAAEQPDILDICLPTAFHEQFVLLGAAHKKHILCEKPFSLSSAACERMARACADAGVKLMVGQVLRWFPEYRKIRELVPALGSLHAVYCNRLAQHPDWSAWHRDPAISGGGLFDLHAHDIDFLLSLFGEVDRVFAAGWKSPTGCWNHVLSTLIFKNGLKAAAEGCMEMAGNFPFTSSFRVVGDKGTLDYQLSAGFNIENLEAAGSRLTLYAKDREPEAVSWEQTDSFRDELDDFAKAVEENKTVPILPEESVYCIRIIEALKKSLETAETVHV